MARRVFAGAALADAVAGSDLAASAAAASDAPDGSLAFATTQAMVSRRPGRSRDVQRATTLAPGHASGSSTASILARFRVTVVVRRVASSPS